jgi:hypothetical protein
MSRSSIRNEGLRDDEEFVIKSVAAAFSGTWRLGENPPDAYLVLGTSSIAVEISTLMQHVSDERGRRSRITDDLATDLLVKCLNEDLKELVPDGHTIGLILISPINQLRKTRPKLGQILREYIADLSMLRNDQKIRVNDNDITVFLNKHGEPHYDKVCAVFPHRSSDPNILENALVILEERITTKANKCRHLQKHQPLWLALLNDYWLAQAGTYYRKCLLIIPSKGYCW